MAQLIGKLTHRGEQPRELLIILFGPGRWGTQMPELGVPTSYAPISTVSVLCEIDAMHAGLSADLSLGTHFFHEAVEMNLLYVGFFQGRAENLLNTELLSELPNRLTDLLPGQADWLEVVHVIEAPQGRMLLLSASQTEQKAILYLEAS